MDRRRKICVKNLGITENGLIVIREILDQTIIEGESNEKVY
jgi:hypothetical protein